VGSQLATFSDGMKIFQNSPKEVHVYHRLFAAWAGEERKKKRKEKTKRGGSLQESRETRSALRCSLADVPK
jgi:hypothetical protein